MWRPFREASAEDPYQADAAEDPPYEVVGMPGSDHRADPENVSNRDMPNTV